MNDREPGARAGTRFGPYQLTRLLGGTVDGTAGEVYAAEDTRDGRLVAVQLIGGPDPGDAVVDARPEHPHLLAVDDHGEVDGVGYLEIPLVDGIDLATLLNRSGPLSPPRAVAIVHQVATALDAAHADGLAHGDVTAGSIWVTDADFGYLLGGLVGGTAGAAGGADDGAADVAALAAVLAECLTGSAPGRVPAALEAVVARGLTTASEARYGSAGELAAAAVDALRRPERNHVGRILRRGRTAPGRSAPVLSASPTLPSQLTRPRWQPPLVSRLRPHRVPIVLGVVLLAVVAAVVSVGYLFTRPSYGSSAAAPRQMVLPFTDLGYRLAPGGVAVGADGAVYVTSQGVSGRLVELPAGSTTPAVLPVGDLYQPHGVAADPHGNVYVSDLNNRVVRSEAGTDVQVVLPFAGLNKPGGVAVDPAGNVYVADRGNNQVVKWEAASNLQSVLPFGALRNPSGVAVAGTGDVYVTDTDNGRVLKLADGTGDPVVLPFAGIAMPWGITVDDNGTVYVTDYRSNKVATLASGSAIPVVLPFTGLNAPSGVAVDSSGNVYVADRGNDRVLKLPS